MAHSLHYLPPQGSVKTTGNGQLEKHPKVKPFRGIDGESYTIEGDHRYVLLCAGGSDHIYDPNGLSTKRCFDFLLDQPPTSIYCAFGLNYDVNMMLRDFGPARLKELWTTGETRWFNYHLEWIPGKWFQITDIKDPIIYTRRKRSGKTTAHMKYRRRIKINEVFGFFQMSFVKALVKWNIEVQDADELEAMKGARSIFDPEMIERMISYCHTECLLLADLMEQLRDALTEAGIKNTSWNGAGSIAGAILKQQKIKDHIDELPEDVELPVMSAYYGGRTELRQQGIFPLVYQYDIVSAYPHACLSLPSLTGGSWRYTDEYRSTADYAIWNCAWEGTEFAPFPYRSKTAIRYYTNGQGWFHTPEVRAALALYPNKVTVSGGWIFEPNDSERPFSFVRDLAARKTEYKRVGHAAEKVLKLGINSLYGKLAQGLGYNDSKPPYQSYYWAGYITSTCRARMLSLAGDVGTEHVIMVATDGIFLDKDPKWSSGDSLGDIERTVLTDTFTVQPGVYHAYNGDSEIKKSRGFFAKEIDFEQLREGFLLDGPFFTGHYSSTRFLGLGSALQRKSMDEWRTWITADRKLTLYPSGKILDPSSESNPIRHLSISNPTPDVLSAPYVPKGGMADDEQEYMQGKEQPLRV